MQTDMGGRSHNEDAVYVYEHPKMDIKLFAKRFVPFSLKRV
ncbi:MAG: hypothetical protein ACE5KT_09140 [Methanosarcinales archaeon]